MFDWFKFFSVIANIMVCTAGFLMFLIVFISFFAAENFDSLGDLLQ